MNHDEAHDPLTFAEVYRRARMAGTEERPPFDLQRGLSELLTWVEREFEIVVDEEADHGNAGSARSGSRMMFDIPAMPMMLHPQIEVRGRRELIDELLELMRWPQEGPAVLTGLGGAGKSTVAAALVERFRGRDRLVWWVSATDPASLSAGLGMVARQLGASSHDVEAIARGAADAPDRLWRSLERATHQWLLVLDNADDPWVLSVGDSPAGVQDGTGWVRSSRRGLVLVTSRETDPRIWEAARLYSVGRLNEADAAQVLRDLAPAAGSIDQARVLARRLDRLPLTLHLAGTYLRSGVAQWTTFAAYGHALGTSGKRFLLESTDTKKPYKPARAAAEISLDGLAHHGIPQARAVLRLASCYAPTLIPTGMFKPYSTARLFGSRAGSRNAQHLLDEALRGLCSVGLIHNSPAESTAAGIAISVHPVVTESNRIALDGSEPESSLIRRTAVDLLVAAIGELRFDLPENWPQYRLLGQHLLALLDTTAKYVDQEYLVKLMTAAAATARAFNRRGASKASRALCRTALARCAALGNIHPMSLRVRHELAWAVAHQGDRAEAETMYRDILDSRQHILDDHDPDTLDSRHELAWIIACQGRWSEAESRYQQTLRDSHQILGPDAPRTLKTRHELAWAIANQGRLQEAYTAFLTILHDRQRVLGDDHPQILSTQHELAWITAKQGRWAEAEALYRHVLDLRQRRLEEDHWETLLTAHELAWTTARQGRLTEAKALYEHVLERRRQALGDDHPDTQKTQWALDELQHGRIVDAHHFA